MASDVRELKAREHAYHRHILELQRYIRGLHRALRSVCNVVNSVDPATVPAAVITPARSGPRRAA
jgi:hypothetical protein